MLFEDIPAPAAKSRFLRLDLLFWLEALALGALTLAVSGLYLRTNQAPGPNRSDALVFDLGAGMGAIGEMESPGSTTLAVPPRRSSPPRPRAPASPILGYTLEAQTAGALGSPGARYP